MKKIIAASLGTCVGIFVAASFAFAQAVPLPPPPPPPVPGAAFAMIALLPSPPPPPPSPAALIRYDGDPRVYVLEGGMKHWIKTAQDFKDLGYDWNAVSVIPASQTYADGDAKTNVRGQVTSQFVHTLAKGSRGDEVSALQQKLKDLGFFPADVAASGMFGPLTQKAVLAFQKAHGLDQIGAVGPKTRALLNQ